MTKLLFVCTGNTCRSPMAEGIFNVYAAAEHLNASAESAGIMVTGAAPACDNAILTAAEYGADLSSHRARRINESMIDACDAVLCMTYGHQSVLERMFPKYAEKIMCLSSEDIADPYGGDLKLYRQTAEQIDAAIRKLPMRKD